VAFQLRQHSGDNAAHFFDWLGTPVDGLIRTIEADFRVLKPERLYLTATGGRKNMVVDAETGLRFSHQFPRQGRSIPDDFLKDYDAFAAKFAFLAERFRNTVRTHPVSFVRRQIRRPDALRLEAAMRSRFPSADMQFLYINNGGEIFTTPLGESVFLPQEKTWGFGDSIGWARMLTARGLVERPFRLATAQIVRIGQDDQLGDRDRHSYAVAMHAFRENPENPWFAFELAQTEQRRGNRRRAAKLAALACRAEPQNRDFALFALQLELEAGGTGLDAKLAEAIQALGQSECLDLRISTARLLAERGRQAEAFRLIEDALERDPDLDPLIFAKAQVLFASRRFEEANAAVEIVRNRRPHSKARTALQARIISALGRPAEGAELVRRLLVKNPSPKLFATYARLVWTATRSDMRASQRRAQQRSLAARALGTVRREAVALCRFVVLNGDALFASASLRPKDRLPPTA
jgi:tetratricopeptide (TPR) repeat protein